MVLIFQEWTYIENSSKTLVYIVDILRLGYLIFRCLYNQIWKEILWKVVHSASSCNDDVHAKIWHIRLRHIAKLVRESTLGSLIVMIKCMCEIRLIEKTTRKTTRQRNKSQMLIASSPFWHCDKMYVKARNKAHSDYIYISIYFGPISLISYKSVVPWYFKLLLDMVEIELK